jgi:hypothetical protein
MDSLACLNIVGLAAVILLAAVAALLAGIAAADGTAHAIPMLPQWQMLGEDMPAQLEALAGVLPVILASYVVHQVSELATSIQSAYNVCCRDLER